MINDNPSGIHSEFADMVRLHNDNLSKTGKRIADYLLQHEGSVADYSIHSLAESAGVGVASIMRFCKALGYSGFADMKYHIQQGKLIIKNNDVGVMPGDDRNVVKQKVLRYAQSYLEKCVLEANNEVLEQISNVVAHAGKICIIGAGSANGIAQAAASMFMSLGVLAYAPEDANMKVRTAALLEPEDVVIGLSFSGYSKAIGDSLYLAKSSGVTTVLITAYRNSLLGKYADYELYTPARNRGNTLNISTTAMGQLALLQIIEAIVQQKNIPHITERAERLRGNGDMNRYSVHQERIMHGRVRITKENE